MFKVALCAALVAICAANDLYRPAPYAPAPYKQPAYKPAPYQAAGSYKQDDYQTHPKYSFDYAVKDEYYNDFGHSESRDGDRTDGQYYVLLPDGRVQYVKYYVDGYSGYVAEVSYSGEPKYNNAYNKPAPSYKVDAYAPAPAAYKADPYAKPAYRPAAYKPAPSAYAPAPYKAPVAYAPAPYKAPAYRPQY